MRKKFLLLVPCLTVAACSVHDVKVKNAKVSASVDRDEVETGDQVTLSWSTKDAASCRLIEGSQTREVPTSGKEILTPAADTIYTINCNATGKGKTGSASAQVHVVQPPKAVITAKNAQIMLGDSVSIEWSCRDSERADLTVNGETTNGLALTGAESYSPAGDALFELTCINKRGKSASAKAQVTVIAETDVQPVFASLAELGQALDISAMTKDCGTGCIYMPYDRERFNDDGTPTDLLRDELRPLITKAQDKVARPGRKVVAFDSTTTFAYGHIQGLASDELTERCEAGFPYSTKDAPITAQFSEPMEGGTENLGMQSLAISIVDDIEVSAKATRGVMKAGTEATLSYKVLGVDAERQAAYMDYEAATGGYTIDSASGTVRAALTEGFEMLRSFPSGYPVPPAANGYSYDPRHDTCSNQLPQVLNERSFANKAQYCGAGSPFQGSLECETGKGLPTKWPFTYYYKTNGQPISAYIQPVPSLRVVSQLAQVQCKKWLPNPARDLGLDDNWTVMAETQYFITDSRWPACGSNCAGKEERTEENDWRFGDIEPGKNMCIDRWAGLDWNSYRARIEAACTGTQLYKEAYAKAQQKTADEDFAKECNTNSACSQSLKSMKSLTDMFSVQALNSILTKEEAAMNKAKAEGKPYLVPEAKLAPAYIVNAMANLAKIEAGLPIVKQIHESKKSTWTGGNRLVHTALSIPGFDNPTDASESVLAYKQGLERAKALVTTDIKALGCKFELTQGRYRKYSAPKIGEIAFPVKKQETVKTKVLMDTTVN